jgi:transcriptional regulator with XRE-family HTH domain
MNLSPAQCRLARYLLDWTLDDLSDKSGVSKKTLNQIENGRVKPFKRTVRDIVEAFNVAGVVFVPAKEGEHEETVALKWGMEDPKFSSDSADDTEQDEINGSTNEGNHALADHWKLRTDLWMELSGESRDALKAAMGRPGRDLFGGAAAE